MNTTIKTYKSYLAMYGIVSLLIVLEYFQRKQNYEECEKIQKSIKEQEKHLKIKLFTKLTNKNVELLLKDVNIPKNRFITACNYYAGVMLKELNVAF